jgi:hypothetical protein
VPDIEGGGIPAEWFDGIPSAADGIGDFEEAQVEEGEAEG